VRVVAVSVVLVDGDNILVRAHHAAERPGRPGMRTADGVPTGALVIFINMLSLHLRHEQVDSVVVCWDGGRSEYRTAIYAGYKASRSIPTAEEAAARPHGLAKEFLALAGVHQVERRGWEADDLIAAYRQAIRPLDTDLVIVSSDHDLLQLLDEHCTQVKVSSRPPLDRWDVERVERELGCAPRHLPYSMALQGDPGDDVPGLAGIGPKKAVKMLAAHRWSWLATLETIEHDRGPEDRALVERAYRLVDLRERLYGSLGLPLAPPPPFRPTSPADASWWPLREFMARYELRSAASRLAEGDLWPAPQDAAAEMRP
jgi:DNA polymerase I